MKKDQHVTRKAAPLFLVCFLLVTVFWSTNVLAVDVEIDVKADIKAATITPGAKTPLDFGVIVPAPNSETTVTLDARSGSAVSDPGAATGNPTWTGGKSGSLEVTSSIDSTLTIAYTVKGQNNVADQISSTAGDTLPLAGTTVTQYSTPSGLSVEAGKAATINVGGKLTIPSSFTKFGIYNGKITVAVTYP